MLKKNPDKGAQLAKDSLLQLSHYHYELPPSRIARFPLAQRDQAKLLYYHEGEIDHHQFNELPSLLPESSLLVYNDTRVVKARLFLKRATGAQIEVLLLHPHEPFDIQQVMASEGQVSWQCIVGNKKRWKPEEVLVLPLKINQVAISLKVSWLDRTTNLLTFTWEGGYSFSQILAAIGNLPLPPYLNREATPADETQYQTIYAASEGAVAAPTAGLHFTDRVLEDLSHRGIDQLHVTLHVGAGTFLPVKSEEVLAHDMHAEQMIVFPAQLDALIGAKGLVIPVGTTSLRFVESLYWLGVSLLSGETLHWQGARFVLPSLYPYEVKITPTVEEALTALKEYMKAHGYPHLIGETKIFILPGYHFPMSQGLITNFHMPETTLMLLVAARIGEDWRKVYETALVKAYRFLSYGDSSLLLP